MRVDGAPRPGLQSLRHEDHHQGFHGAEDLAAVITRLEYLAGMSAVAAPPM